MKWKAVLFDAAGTLIELQSPVANSYARIASAHGVELAPARIDRAWKQVMARQARRCFPGAHPADVPGLERTWWHEVVQATFRAAEPAIRFSDFDAFFRELFEWYASAEAWCTRPQVEPTLALLRASGLRLGIVSDFDYRLTQVLESLGIARLFDVIVLASTVGAAKPDRRPFEAALSNLGLSAGDGVYVGDDPARDLTGAAAAGLAALDVASLDDFADLPERLATL